MKDDSCLATLLNFNLNIKMFPKTPITDSMIIVVNNMQYRVYIFTIESTESVEYSLLANTI